MPSKKNQESLKEFTAILKEYDDFFITENQGMSVAEITSLRKKLKENGSIYKIVKNRVFKIALRDRNITDIDSFLKQGNGILFVKDPIKDAKILAGFMKEAKDKITIKAGFADGQIIDAAYIETLSKLASKEELIAKLLMILKNPVQKFVIAANAIAQQKEN